MHHACMHVLWVLVRCSALMPALKGNCNSNNNNNYGHKQHQRRHTVPNVSWHKNKKWLAPITWQIILSGNNYTAREVREAEREIERERDWQTQSELKRKQTKKKSKNKAGRRIMKTESVFYFCSLVCLFVGFFFFFFSTKFNCMYVCMCTVVAVL